jgi:hypothetical protein
LIQTTITEDPGPVWTGSGEKLAQRMEQLCSIDLDYFRRRATQEAEAARAVSCCEARLAHEEMAEAYRLLCQSQKPSGSAIGLGTVRGRV